MSDHQHNWGPWVENPFRDDGPRLRMCLDSTCGMQESESGHAEPETPTLDRERLAAWFFNNEADQDWMRRAAKEIVLRMCATFPEVKDTAAIGWDVPVANIIAKHEHSELAKARSEGAEAMRQKFKAIVARVVDGAETVCADEELSAIRAVEERILDELSALSLEMPDTEKK